VALQDLNKDSVIIIEFRTLLPCFVSAHQFVVYFNTLCKSTLCDSVTTFFSSHVPIG
jgi:hypothetical protein